MYRTINPINGNTIDIPASVAKRMYILRVFPDHVHGPYGYKLSGFATEWAIKKKNQIKNTRTF